MNESPAAANNPYSPPRAAVDTPPTGVTGPVLAERGTRLGAVLLDGFVVGLVIYLPMMVTAMPTIMRSVVARQPLVWTAAMLGGIAMSLLLAVISIVVTCVLVARNGQTIGKKLLGIKVVRSDGSKASLGRIFWLRNVVNAIPSMVPIVGLGYTLVDQLLIFGEPRQCLHDKIADTIVVRA
jgi:uncharacterized RDD family membrane protein YckC